MVVRGWLALAVVACAGGEPESTELDEVALCAKTAQCPGIDAQLSLSNCVARLRGADRSRPRILETSATSESVALAFVDCLVEADGDCEVVETCLRPPRVSEDVCGGQEGFHEVCDRNIAVSCWANGDEVYSDCKAAGLVCETFANGVGCVADGQCSADTCDGDVLVTCLGGSTTRSDCRGALFVGCSGDCKTRVTDTCGERDGAPACVATGDACDEASFVDTCEGDTLLTCSRGNVGTLDCAAEGDGFTCQQEGTSGIFFCGPTAPECTFEDADTCDEGVIGYCDAGQRATFDCASIGASGCAPQTDDIDRIYQVCTSE